MEESLGPDLISKYGVPGNLEPTEQVLAYLTMEFMKSS